MNLKAMWNYIKAYFIALIWNNVAGYFTTYNRKTISCLTWALSNLILLFLLELSIWLLVQIFSVTTFFCNSYIVSVFSMGGFYLTCAKCRIQKHSTIHLQNSVWEVQKNILCSFWKYRGLLCVSKLFSYFVPFSKLYFHAADAPKLCLRRVPS